MIGIDTNVLVRFFAQDDPAQSQQASAFLMTLTEVRTGYVSVVTLVEMLWVLRAVYRISRDAQVTILERLLDLPQVVLEREPEIWETLERFRRSKVGFADQLIERCCHAAGCTTTVTFDADAARLAGMKLL